eukprot:363954-Chlamydomonas_euryale.AAC.6
MHKQKSDHGAHRGWRVGLIGERGAGVVIKRNRPRIGGQSRNSPPSAAALKKSKVQHRPHWCRTHTSAQLRGMDTPSRSIPRNFHVTST